ncbi:MAG: hypothetical protein HC828_12335 [Blastochloris sp.]|nr:hypothetical protein [Blastochloris sp.]
MITEPEKVLAFLDRLEAVNLWYNLTHVRDSIMVKVFVPGEIWEVEFFEDGHVEVERFVSTGDIEGEEAIDRLFALHSD